MADNVMEHWLQLIAGKLDRLIELGENVERAIRSQEMPEEWGEHEADHFAGADKMVSEGPNNLRISIARELEGYRLVNDSDIGKIVEVQNSTADPWRECTLLAIDWDRPYGFLCGHVGFYRPMKWRFARIKIEPAKEPEHPACVVPDQGEGGCEPTEKGIGGDIEVIATARWIHGRRSPAEPPASEKPAEPEYREPVLPADAGKLCEFSIDGNAWTEAKLRGYAGHLWQSVCSEVVGAKHWVHARIKKES